jgi:hypothetical protein
MGTLKAYIIIAYNVCVSISVIVKKLSMKGDLFRL